MVELDFRGCKTKEVTKDEWDKRFSIGKE